MPKEEFAEFRMLLRKGMGTRTQAEFARDAGISPQVLNRMMNLPVISRPRAKTLQMLAAQTEGVSLKELMESVGYDINGEPEEEELTEKEKRETLSNKERANLAAKDLTTGLAELTSGGNAVYDNLNDFLDMLYVLYSVEEFSFQIISEDEYDGEKYPAADEIALVETSFLNGQVVNVIPFAVYFYRKKDGRIFITNADAGFEALKEVGFFEPREQEAMEEFGHGADQPVIYSVNRFKKRVSPDKKDGDAKKRLLEALFGTGETFDTTVIGFGFELKSTPKAFPEFLKAHKETFLSIDNIYPKIPEKKDPETLYKEIENGNDPDEVLKDYMDQDRTGYGVGAAIASIMRKETGFGFSYWSDTEHEFEDNPDCILIPDDENNGGYRTVKEIVNRYAAELGIPEFGACYFKVRWTKDSNSWYKTDFSVLQKDTDTWHSIEKELPKNTGLYKAKLRGGTVKPMLYIKDRGHWVASGKEWSREVREWADLKNT